ncbi:PTS lactose/cellobiose transporter subunit IIA [Vibrio mediterranei]|jgi:PTS system cellobiose-specific IIA component|uniref:PTS lactose/cellobiose transporter subunit IIA n=1 Tax=Vibrio mediterranei TaxID=689 RepID=UPI001EFD3AEE|nr:PTS lactose/cellobiose transporter subunit IIA [Vibrio mediterranei]MCG9627751.1 PTS lactose/cellobiose transporter subunit IIA [Vibrio mediterranei]MCY9855092.1 PTS lactose/cellobiose transporter subunit IIA [Vibrio mediterranei]
MIEINSSEDISEEFLMTLLCTVGEAKSSFMQALVEARKGSFSKVHELMSYGDEVLAKVHKTQTGLIGFDEGKGKVTMTLILTHIQDHIMTTMLCRDLAVEIIALRKELRG